MGFEFEVFMSNRANFPKMGGCLKWCALTFVAELNVLGNDLLFDILMPNNSLNSDSFGDFSRLRLFFVSEKPWSFSE